jgi:hypothetical protein
LFAICSPQTAVATTARPFQLLRAALVALLATVATMAIAAPAHANLAAVGANDPATGAPAWFEDGNGLKLGLCLDGPPYCLTSAADFAAPNGEGFYFQAQGDLTIGAAGTAKLILAQEAVNTPGGPGAFMRVRVTITAARPNSPYVVTEPFGTIRLTTDGLGNAKSTVDTGCPLGPCASFANALTGEIGPFLQWDPRVAPAPPAGHIGDSATLHAVVGGTNGNSFTVAGVGGSTTNLFTVAGKLAGPPVPVYDGPASMDFGGSAVGASTSQAATIVSFGVPDLGTGQSNLVVAGVGLSGPAASDYQIVSNTCSANSFPSGAGCMLGVQFTPTAAGARPATIDIGTNAVGSVRHIALTGVGIAPSAGVAAASARNRLAIRKLRTTHRMSRARVARKGLRLSMVLPQGTEIIKIAVNRIRHNKVVRKPVWVGFRVAPSRTGLYHLTLDSRALRRRMKVGLYVVQVTPGASKQQLGATTTTRIRITRH